MDNIRKEMIKRNIDCVIITSSDFNNSEYINDYFKVREYYSGFTGSAGTLVIDLKKAYLFTDGRYFLQAKKELKKGITLMRMGIDTPLDEFLNNYKNIGANLKTIPANFGIKHNIKSFDFAFENYKREYINFTDFLVFNESTTGESYKSKVEKIRLHLKNKDSKYFITTSLDEIAYILNIRGFDIPYCMLNYAYLIVSLDKIILFTDKTIDLDITIYPFNDFYAYLKQIKGKVLIDSSSLNYEAYLLLSNFLDEKSIISYLKSIKNEIEIKNIKLTLLKDSALMIRFIDYLKNNYKNLNEKQASNYLDNLRKNEENFLDLSFSTIAAYNESAAELHYNGNNNLNLNDGLFLVDSGGQYKTGTTDITRTILLGMVNDDFKNYYTYALKSLIALSNVTFKLGTTGGELDFLARSKIFEYFLDYRCGTGHGVGFISNVHEGPNSFRYHNETIIEENMITTIEPGVYIDNLVGIRHENMVLSKKIIDNEYGTYLKFETLTFIPFEIDCINKELLNNDEIKWINDYHKEIFNKLKNYFSDNIDLLKKYTKEL